MCYEKKTASLKFRLSFFLVTVHTLAGGISKNDEF